MPVRIADAVNWGDLRDTVVASLLAGVGICAGYGFALLGWVRAREHHEGGEPGLAAIYGLIGTAGLAVTVGGVVLGLIFVAGD